MKASLAATLAVGALAVGGLADRAEAAVSVDCQNLINGIYSLPNVAVGSFNNTPLAVTLNKDEKITVVFTNLEFFFWDVNAVPVVINQQNGNDEFVVPADGVYNLDRSVQGPIAAPPGSLIFSCVPVPATQSQNGVPGTGDQVDAARRVLFSYNYFNSFTPETFPESQGPSEPDPIADCEQKLAVATADYEKKVKEYEDAKERLEGYLILGVPYGSLVSEVNSKQADVGIASSKVSLLKNQCKELKSPSDFTLVQNTGNTQVESPQDGPDDPDGDLEELGDGESILYAPLERKLAANIPWPFEASAYGPGFTSTQNISSTSNHYLTLGGLPVNIWARVKGTLYDGSFGRSGGSGQGMVGVVVGITPMVDVGVFGHIIGGKITSTTLNGSLESVSGGAGAHVMVKMPSRLRFGVSGSHTWGKHDIVVAGGAGSFVSSHWTFDASLARPFDVHDFVVTPMALLTYNHVSLGAYRDSNGVSVPKSTDSTLAISAALNVAYPMEINGSFIRTIIPRINVRANFFAKRAATLQLGPGLALESSAVTVEVSGGVGFALQNGGNLDLAISATGLGGDIRGYSARGTFRIPLN